MEDLTLILILLGTVYTIPENPPLKKMVANLTFFIRLPIFMMHFYLYARLVFLL